MENESIRNIAFDIMQHLSPDIIHRWHGVFMEVEDLLDKHLISKIGTLLVLWRVMLWISINQKY